MEKGKVKAVSFAAIAALLVLSACCMLFSGTIAPTASAADVSGYETADSVYDFTFTDSAAFASKWGAQASTVMFNDCDRTMQIAATQTIDGTVVLGSYRTKFDIKFGAGNWYRLFLRHNSGEGRKQAAGDYKSAVLDTGANRGYCLFIANQYVQLMETVGDTNNTVAGSAPIDTVSPLGSEKWYTFEISVLNLTDGSVQFIVDVDGKTYINANTKNIQNSLFDEPITEGALRITSSNVATEYRGYNSQTAPQLELFTQAQFENWTGNGGAADSAPMAWQNGGYAIGAFTEKTGWPASLQNATALIGSEDIGGFSARFTFNGSKVANPVAAHPYSLQLAYLEPNVKSQSWMGNAKNTLLNENGWVNGYTIRLDLQNNYVILIASNNSGEMKQMYWNSNGVNFADGQDHAFYWSVKSAPNRQYQIVTLEIDGKTLIDYHSATPWSRSGAGVTELTEEEKSKYLIGCQVGSFQIVTQGITGTFTNAGDNDFADNYFVTDVPRNNPDVETGITLENGTLTVPRGDKNGSDGKGWHWQEQVFVATKRKISANSAIAFDFSAEQISGKTPALNIYVNNEKQYPANNDYNNAACYILDAGGGSFLPGNKSYSGSAIMDGNKHRIVISSALSDSGLTVKFYIDGVAKNAYTYADESYLHNGYFNMYAQGLDNITVSNLTVYDDSFAQVERIRLLGTPKTEYTVGEELDLTDLRLLAVYRDGTHAEMAVTADMVSGFDNKTPSENMTLTVAFGGATATYDIVMKSNEEVSYAVKSGYKNRYKVGEEYAGDIVALKTQDGQTTEIPVTAAMLGDSFTTERGGSVTLSFTVEEHELTAEIFVEKELIGITVNGGYKTDYAIGAVFDYNDLKGKLNLLYNDGSQENADITPDMLSRRGAAKGRNDITVSYGGHYALLTLNGTGADAWDNDGDGEKRANLPSINIADKEVMNLGPIATAAGNAVAFGPSKGGFGTYATTEKFPAYRMAFDMKIPAGAADANQRILVRSSVAGNEGIVGYYILIYKSNLQLYRRPSNCLTTSGYRIAASSFTEAQIGGANIYDDKYHSVVVEVFNRDNGAVVVNVAIDGVYAMHAVDDGTLAATAWENVPIPEADRRAVPEAGFAGFTMNSAVTWMLKGEYADSSFVADTYMGDPNFYNVRATATVSSGSVSFANGNVAYSANELTGVNAEFMLKAESASADGDEVLFAIAPLSDRIAAESCGTANGWIVNFYCDKAEITLYGKVYATLTGLNLSADRTANIKLSVNSLCGESLIGLCVDGEWIGAAAPTDKANSSGYSGLYAFAAAELTADIEAVRNYRVLFVGNSITNHGSNPDIGYGIGDGADSWGMATSAPEYDYVHLVMASIRAIPGYKRAEFKALNVAEWERAYATYDYVRYFADGAAFEPDLIIGRLGENAQSCTASYIRNNDFTHYYGKLLSFFDSKGTAKKVLTTSYWGDEHYDRDSGIDSAIVKLARKNGYPLVRLGDLGSKYKEINNATADGDYYKNLAGNAPGGWSWETEWNNWSGAVKSHPGMTGMRNIAARITESVSDILTGDTGEISRYEEVISGVYAEYTQSDLYGNVAGAYDYKKLGDISVREIGDASQYVFAQNYRLYKAYSIDKTGDIYRISIPLYANTNAGFSFKAYTLAGGGELSEVFCYTNTESEAEPVLAVDGTTLGSALFIAVEYNPQAVFADKKLNDARYGNLLKWLSADKDVLLLDVSGLGYNDLTVERNMYGALVSSGKAVEIRFAQGSMLINADTFEVISSTENNLYFSVTALGGNFLRNATAAVKGLSDKYEFISTTSEGYVGEVFETQISYNNRNGDALYLNNGVKTHISVALTAEQAKRLVVITAALPAIGQNVRYPEVLDGSMYSYENGVLTLQIKDFDGDVILALGSTATLTLKEGYKTEYKVGEPLSVENMTLEYTDPSGNVAFIAVTPEMVSGFANDSAGTVLITVTYRGLSVTASLTVSATEEKPVPEEGGCGCGSDLRSDVAIGGAVLLCAAAVLCARRRKRAK